MRIQHNIAALNAYRNYSSNTRTVSKNLEKVSSGYRINRAGDDAAGLAISEKMRAQVTSLDTAQKNAKDGISLVQTAEGALTEVHSMLNRMVELADQSSNGTYDNEVDRANLQKEVSALKTEIDRIADSSNFNGIKLLDGSLAGSTSTAGSVDGAATVFVGGAGALGDGAAVNGVYSGNLKLGTAETDKMVDKTVATNGAALQLKLTTDDGNSYTLNFVAGPANDMTAADLRTAIQKQLQTPSAEFKELNPDWEKVSSLFDITVKDGGGGAGQSATGELDVTFTAKNAGVGQPKVTGMTLEGHEIDGVTGKIEAAAAAVGSGNATTVAATVTGGVATATAATDAYKKISFSDDNDALENKTVTIGANTYQFVKAADLSNVAEGNKAVVLGDDKTETMTNLVARLKGDGVSSASVYNTGTDTLVRIGNIDDIKVSNKQAVTASSTSKGVTLGNDTSVDAKYTVDVTAPKGEAQDLTFNYTDKDGKAQSYKLSLTEDTVKAWDADGAATGTPTEGEATDALVDVINKDATLKEMFNASKDGSGNLVLEAKDNKNGVTLTSLTAKGATGNNLLGTTAAGDTVNITSSNGTNAYGAGQTITMDNNSLKSGDTLEVNGKTYQFLNEGDLSKLQSGATAVMIGADSETTAENLKVALKNDGIVAKNPTESSGKLLIENDTEVETTGGLTLQIGETSESFNHIKVTVDDMHTKGLGIADVDISTQKGAQDAVQTIKNAINSVSSTRGTLGATQNRLEHTMNNLSVMQENIQDAESNIRDVDVAKEMMAYTKNNILVQSAQAMLAQANQAPQGVLQLLQ